MANVLTPTFRVSYPHVFKPNRNKLSNTDEYSIVALFPKGADLSALKKAATEAVEKKWPNKDSRPKNIKTPFRDQGEKEKDGTLPPGHEKGAIFMNLKSKQRPGLVDQNVQDIIDETDFYPGCYARATIRAYAYDQAGNRGVSFGLQNIQKMKDGEPFGSRTRAEDDFEQVSIEDGGATGATKNTDELFG